MGAKSKFAADGCDINSLDEPGTKTRAGHGQPIAHQRLLALGWFALFTCLLCSLIYVFCNLVYGHHYRERELAEAKKKKFEVEADEIRHLNVANLQTEAELAAFINPRREAARQLGKIAARHIKSQKTYLLMWTYAGRVAQLGFVLGIGLLLAFAILNTQEKPLNQSHAQKSSGVCRLVEKAVVLDFS